MTEEVDMALSDQLTRLASRAKEAEDRAGAAQNKAKADLERVVDDARAAAQTLAQSVSVTAEADEAKASDWWNDIQRTCNQHIGAIRQNIDNKKAEIDVDK